MLGLLRSLTTSVTGDDPPPWWPKPPRRLRDQAMAVAVGRWVGLAFGVCLLTGVFSHLEQHPTAWFPLPTGPVWIFQLTQGLHVATGLAAVPLLLVKLWTVYPNLFSWPPARTLAAVLERGSIGVLVAGSVFELVTGLFNILQWYPWPFGFIQVHWWVAWLTTGALVLHVSVKAPVIGQYWTRSRRDALPAKPVEPVVPVGPLEPADGLAGVSRRALLLGAGGAAAVITAVTAGQTVAWLRPLAVLAPRQPGQGTTGVPINRTAQAAGVVALASDPAWRLTVAGRTPLTLSLAQLRALPQYSARLPIACVEGWSASALWTGVRLRDVLDAAGLDPAADLRTVSLEPSGANPRAELPAAFARDPLTLLALAIDGEALSLDHGWPCRLIAPGRPGVAQTKWLSRIELLPS